MELYQDIAVLCAAISPLFLRFFLVPVVNTGQLPRVIRELDIQQRSQSKATQGSVTDSRNEQDGKTRICRALKNTE